VKPHKIVNHSKTVLEIAKDYGWWIGARYTNTRDIKAFKTIDFVDIDWKHYSFDKHLSAVKAYQPKLTVARDIEDISNLDLILKQAKILSDYAENIIIVPKATELSDIMENYIPSRYLFGYSVPTKYGGTEIPLHCFKRKVHLLGGRPDVQKKLADHLNVNSFDCNRFTLDARFGDYFNGTRFVPHPIGGYLNCIKDSIVNINLMWT
jgi:hypothetical protein